MTRVTLGVLSRSWHWLAYLYFLAMSAALLIQPEQALPQMLMATLQTVLAVLIGMSLIGLLQPRWDSRLRYLR